MTRTSALLRALPWLSVAVLGGIAWGLCFGRQTLPVASWLALTPLFLLLRLPSRWRMALALVWGLAFWITSIPWISYTLENYGQVGATVSILLLGVLALYLSLYTVVFVGLGGWLWQRLGGGTATLFVLPALWVALDLIRGWVLKGFPWNLSAYAWTDVPGALVTSAWIGPYGLSYLVVLGNLAWVLALPVSQLRPEEDAGRRARYRWRLPATAVLSLLLLLAVGERWAGARSSGSAAPGLARPGQGQAVRLLQPNIENLVDLDWQRIRANVQRTLEQSRQACDVPGALVVWPESAGWPYSFTRASVADQEFKSRLEAQAAAGCPMLFNSIYYPPPREKETEEETVEEGTFYNSAFLLQPDASHERYDKRHLVPYGEYVPLKDVLPFVESLARNAGDFTPGATTGLVAWGREKLGLAICYEVIFPGEVAETVQDGATVLATLSNDAWYGDSIALNQLFRSARFRAAENHRPLLRAAITGISGVIDARGRVDQRLGIGEQGVLKARIEGRRNKTLYSRVPWAVPALCWLVTLGAIVFSFLVNPRRPR